ncbi:MAG: Bug family tripartite tricarboxylate transporter substrate binding protein [Lautropia sp.]
MKRLSLLRFALCLSSTLLAVNTGSAQPYPAKPIEIVVGSPPGGGSDYMARLVGTFMSERMGQQVVVVNRPGAEGAIAAASVARAAPDGYTVLFCNNPPITMAPHLRALPYDAAKDLVPLFRLADVSTVLTTAASSQFSTMKDVLAWAQRNPGKVSYGTFGPASTWGVEFAQLKDATGLDLVQVSYKGAAPIVADTVSGQITIGASGPHAVLPLIRSGKLKALAVWSDSRLAVLPDTPTIREATGRELTSFPTWFGMFLPARTPPGIVKRLESEVQAVMKDPEVAGKVAGTGANVAPEGAVAFAALLGAESSDFAARVEKYQIKEK